MSIADKLNTIAENEQKVFEAGRKKEHQEFWNNYFGTDPRWSFSYRFAGSGWNSKTFKPTRDMDVRGGSAMFMYSSINVDLVEYLEQLGVTLDFSNCSGGSQIFSGSAFIRLGLLNFRTLSSLTGIFQNCKYLKTIDKIVLKDDGSQTFSSPFSGCTVLENITFEGVIGRSISFSSSPLTLESACSIITHLKDYSGTADANKYTVTFSSNTWVLLDEAEWIFTLPNGDDCNSRDYIQSKGWLI